MKYRIKSKLRFSIFITLVFVLGLIFILNITGHVEALSITTEEQTEVMIIRGDNLWNLAKEYGPEGQDIRKVVHAICKINNITADQLQVGQKIIIPKYI